jgi:protein HOOK2
LDLTAIARSGDTTEICKLMELVLGAAVSCDTKDTYVQNIMTLNEGAQEQLMYIIQKVLDKCGKSKSETDERKEA